MAYDIPIGLSEKCKEVKEQVNKILSDFKEEYFKTPSELMIFINQETSELDFIVDLNNIKSS